MGKKFLRLFIVATLVLLVGCGGGPKSDVSVFMMPPNGIPQEITEKIEESLIAQLGESPTVQVGGSPIFDLNKEMVEVAAGGHLIYVFGEERFKTWALQGSLSNLDEIFDPADYPSGVVEADVSEDSDNPIIEKHLYGIPMSESKLMKAAGYQGEEIYAFMLPRVDDMGQATQVLKALVER